MNDLAGFAMALDEAARTARAIRQLSSSVSLGLSDAYDVQARVVARRIERGERVIGVKLGFTSRAKALQMGVHDLIVGRLTDEMLIEDNGRVDLRRFVHPRIEPEIAFLLKAPLTPRMNVAQAMTTVAAVAPAMELIDSRYESFEFNLTDVVADNCSSAGLVIGPWCSPDVDISNLGVVLEFNGRPAQIGSTAAILGHPQRAIAALARLADVAGIELLPGWIVLAGAATAAEPLRPGMHVRTVIQGLGAVCVTTSTADA